MGASPLPARTALRAFDATVLPGLGAAASVAAHLNGERAERRVELRLGEILVGRTGVVLGRSAARAGDVRAPRREVVHGTKRWTPDLVIVGYRLAGRTWDPRIEVKSQATSGSAIEKVVTRIATMGFYRLHHDRPAVLVLDASLRSQPASELENILSSCHERGVSVLWGDRLSSRGLRAALLEQVALIDAKAAVEPVWADDSLDAHRDGSTCPGRRVCAACRVLLHLWADEHHHAG